MFFSLETTKFHTYKILKSLYTPHFIPMKHGFKMYQLRNLVLAKISPAKILFIRRVKPLQHPLDFERNTLLAWDI